MIEIDFEFNGGVSEQRVWGPSILRENPTSDGETLGYLRKVERKSSDRGA